MSERTKIEWCHHTFNPWIGCTKVSPGCKNCYAESLAKRSPALVLGKHEDRPDSHLVPVWGDQAPRRVTSADYWRQPLRWNRAAQAAGERRRVFCASMADVFEDFSGQVIDDEAEDRGFRDLDSVRGTLWALIQETPHLDWLLLTKRPHNVYGMIPGDWIHSDRCQRHMQGGCGGTCDVWPRNVWIGCTVEDQQRAEERLPHLLRIHAPVRFVSYEPALEAVRFERVDLGGRVCDALSSPPFFDRPFQGGKIDWVIVGGESGAHARPFDLAWARAAVAQCKAAGVPVFVKQLGARPLVAEERWRADGASIRPGDRPKAYASADSDLLRLELRDKKGGDMDEWPEDLRVREFPEVGA